MYSSTAVFQAVIMGTHGSEEMYQGWVWLCNRMRQIQLLLSPFCSQLKFVLCWTVYDEMCRISAVGTVDAWSLRIDDQCARTQSTDPFLEEVNLRIVKCSLSSSTTCPSGLLGHWECIAMSSCLDRLVQPEQKAMSAGFTNCERQEIWAHTHLQIWSLVIGSGVTYLFLYPQDDDQKHFGRVWQNDHKIYPSLDLTTVANINAFLLVRENTGVILRQEV